MKQTDLNLIKQTTESILNEKWSNLPFAEYFPQNVIETYIISVYMHNDITNAIGMDYKVENDNTMSFLATRYKMVSFIDDAKAWIKRDEPICRYDNYEDDIYNIIRTMALAMIKAIDNYDNK